MTLTKKHKPAENVIVFEPRIEKDARKLATAKGNDTMKTIRLYKSCNIHTTPPCCLWWCLPRCVRCVTSRRDRRRCVAVTDDRNRRTKNNDVVTARGYRKLCFFIRTRIMLRTISAPLSTATTTRDLTARLAITWPLRQLAARRPTTADDCRARARDSSAGRSVARGGRRQPMMAEPERCAIWHNNAAVAFLCICLPILKDTFFLKKTFSHQITLNILNILISLKII